MQSKSKIKVNKSRYLYRFWYICLDNNYHDNSIIIKCLASICDPSSRYCPDVSELLIQVTVKNHKFLDLVVQIYRRSLDLIK